MRDRDIPFTFAYADPLVPGVGNGGIPGLRAAVVIDRRNAILVSDFGKQVRQETLGDVIAEKLSDSGYTGTLEVRPRGRVLFFSAVLDDFHGGASIAGQKVRAKRYWFSQAGRSWEISCQYTPDRRRLMLRACDLAVATLRFPG